ncbi:tetratricopeptide repeat protein [Candidatus Uabimicrobium sp. HlEnr_7]|uniref:tetratricopeptide repeat protein n=1 Tax=Candidatus Uabimicrobium helgolandensis TaxID=3095367 RepID=UPI0035574BE4
MIRKFIVCVFAICSLNIYANDGVINGRDDVEFAKALARSGYYDLAEDIRQLIQQKGSRQQRKETELLRCLFIKEKAQREPDPQKKKNTYSEAIQCYESRLGSVGGIENAKLKLELADLMVTQAQEIIEESRQKNEQISGVNEILAGAGKRFREVKSEYDDAGTNLEAKSATVRDKANLRYHSWYGLCRVYYFQGLAGGQGKLDMCSSELENYMGDYEGLIGSYYAMLLNGLVLHEKGSYGDAIIFYDGVLRPLMNVDHPKAIELSIQSCYYQIQTYNKWKRFSKSAQLAGDFEKHMNDKLAVKLERESYGQALLLELGRAYVGQGEYGKALKIAEKIAGLQTYWSIVAKRLLLEWGKLSPTALQNAKNAHLVASGLASKEEYHEAILAYLKVIKYSKKKSDIAKYAIDSWEKMGQLYWHLGLYQESAMCYETCATSKKYRLKKVVEKKINGKIVEQKISITAKSAYWAYRGFKEAYKQTKDGYLKNKSDKMRNYLVKKYSNSPYAKNLSYSAADDKERIARSTKNYVASAKAYEKAANAYRSVSPQADAYERSLVNIGKCYYNAAKKYEQKSKTSTKKPGSFRMNNKSESLYKRAVSELKNYHTYTKQNRLSDLELDKKSRRKEAMAESFYFLGRSYLRLKDVARGSKYLETLCERYPEQSDMLAQATYLLVKSNLNANNLKKAESFIKRTEKIYGAKGGSSASAIYRSAAYNLAGRKYYSLAANADEKYDALKKKDTLDQKELKKALDLRVDYYTKSADYLNKWYLYRSSLKVNSLDWIASTQVITAKLLKETGQTQKANTMFSSALKVFRKCLSRNKDPKKEKELQEKTAECAIETGNWEQAIYVFYPIFAQDRIERKEKNDSQTEDALYLDYLSRILAGLAQQVSYKDADKLHSFLQTYLSKELVSDISKHIPTKVSETVFYNEYIRAQIIIAKVNDSALSDGERKELSDEFNKQKDELNQITEEERLDRGIKTLQVTYRDKALNLIEEKLPQNSKEAHGDAGQRIKNMCLYLSYDYTSKLLDRLSPYQNPQVRFGNYDNPQWWETKYRQFLILQLRGEGARVKGLIKALRLNQRKMGGPVYQRKFQELSERS